MEEGCDNLTNEEFFLFLNYLKYSCFPIHITANRIYWKRSITFSNHKILSERDNLSYNRLSQVPPMSFSAELILLCTGTSLSLISYQIDNFVKIYDICWIAQKLFKFRGWNPTFLVNYYASHAISYELTEFLFETAWQMVPTPSHSRKTRSNSKNGTTNPFKSFPYELKYQFLYQKSWNCPLL